MNLTQMLKLEAGGPGSGCRGDRCGRPKSAPTLDNLLPTATPKMMPPLVYHGTASSLMAKIKKEGFIPGAGHGADSWAEKNFGKGVVPSAPVKSVFMSPFEERAKEYAAAAVEMNPGSEPVIAIIQPPKPHLFEQDDQDHTAVRYPGRIPPTWIRGWITGAEARAPQGGFVNPRTGTHVPVHATAGGKKAGLVYAVFLADTAE